MGESDVRVWWSLNQILLSGRKYITDIRGVNKERRDYLGKESSDTSEIRKNA